MMVHRNRWFRPSLTCQGALDKNRESWPRCGTKRGTAPYKGEFVAFLDADDVWERDKVRAQEACLTQYPIAVACYTHV